MKVREEELFASSIRMELDDVNALWHRRLAIDRYAEMLKKGFETLDHDGNHYKRRLLLNLHSWVFGQLLHISYLDESLGMMMRRQGVWATSGIEIID
jgi:hypothetical protein